MKTLLKKVCSGKCFFAEHSILFFCLSIILIGQSCVTIDPGGNWFKS